MHAGRALPNAVRLRALPTIFSPAVTSVQALDLACGLQNRLAVVCYRLQLRLVCLDYVRWQRRVAQRSRGRIHLALVNRPPEEVHDLDILAVWRLLVQQAPAKA